MRTMQSKMAYQSRMQDRSGATSLTMPAQSSSSIRFAWLQAFGKKRFSTLPVPKIGSSGPLCTSACFEVSNQ